MDAARAIAPALLAGPAFDAKFFQVALPKDVPASIQERAYPSPIWYTP